MSIEKVRSYLTRYGLDSRILEFETSSATVELAAAAAGCEPARIAKSLSFLVDGKAILVVAAGDAKVDNGKYKAQFGTKAKMLSPDQVLGLLAGRGSNNSAIELTIPELEEASRCIQWVDVCKNWTA